MGGEENWKPFSPHYAFYLTTQKLLSAKKNVFGSGFFLIQTTTK